MRLSFSPYLTLLNEAEYFLPRLVMNYFLYQELDMT